MRTGYVYHILSRGVNRAPIVLDDRDFQRFLSVFDYCRYSDYPFKFSFFKTLSREQREKIRAGLKEKFIGVIAYCLMPNHFHFVLRQEMDNGIVSFINRLLTSYTKFFNTKHKRSGPLFDGRFKAVLVETDEQLLHLVRYVHLNPYSSAVVESIDDLLLYPWSSLSEYLDSEKGPEICSAKEMVLSQFADKEKLSRFIFDQADYQKRLEEIKHLLEE